MGDGKKELMRQVEERHKEIPTEPYDVYLHEDIHEETEYICTGTTSTCTRTDGTHSRSAAVDVTNPYLPLSSTTGRAGRPSVDSGDADTTWLQALRKNQSKDEGSPS